MDMDDQEDRVVAPRARAGYKYQEMLQAVADRQRDTVEIDLGDFEQFYRDDREGLSTLASMLRNTLRYRDLVAQAVDRLMPPSSVELTHTDSVLDVVMTQRMERDAALRAAAAQTSGTEPQEPPPSAFPPILTRRYTVYMVAPSAGTPLAVRQVRATDIGRLLTVRGIVTRVTDVRPLLSVCAYACDACGAEVFQEIKARQYTPMSECPSDMCTRNQVRGRLFLQTRASRFLRYQEARIQEMPDQVPVGHIPRTLTLHLTEGMTRGCGPGDVVEVSGIFLPVPFTGFRALRAGLLADTFLEVQRIRRVKRPYGSEKEEGGDAGVMERVASLLRHVREGGPSAEMEVYDQLTRSIAPEIYGHEDVKRSLLLLLVGGVGKQVGGGQETKADGMRIRGDINVCLMGDPGVAKSQLLRFVCRVAPRGVYTTGKGSSGVGLTAAVTKDPVTDEMILEGGALVLADQGICCVDEFDKMDEGDRAGIHEVMEQQTCSISKAGITTTLNARTSILAAANPAFGRYNPRKSPEENIQLPAALLSRFDIMYLMLDIPDREVDEHLARHVTSVHATGKDYVGVDVLRAFIGEARSMRPTIPKEVGDYLVGVYVERRGKDDRAKRSSDSRDRENGGRHKDEGVYTTPRTLLALTRLAQARARLGLRSQVRLSDVSEAIRLMDASRSSLLIGRGGDREMGGAGQEGVSGRIYHVILGMRQDAMTGQAEVNDLSYTDVLVRVQGRGWTEDELLQCLTEYEEINVLMLNASRTRISFL
ncbi:MCM2/3/5 family-domain-containing protein [Piptocephalis cylindrospora]|uniref:DNA replication licensing factor MCM7 n=1 Tax=Piptocephalis cylindrospora TaxID=1907219 RepID=A0A4P9Y3X7_9FUNG|nr:MCM2/3/5 family-domain-containing protein [Piptocephalis cylindrospora]|eukprot:RKP13533.1 MCM2/3/5 family-domain-containing protein [Piptocephalis cylindrospora]